MQDVGMQYVGMQDVGMQDVGMQYMWECKMWECNICGNARCGNAIYVGMQYMWECKMWECKMWACKMWEHVGTCGSVATFMHLEECKNMREATRPRGGAFRVFPTGPRRDLSLHPKYYCFNCFSAMHVEGAPASCCSTCCSIWKTL